MSPAVAAVALVMLLARGSGRDSSAPDWGTLVVVFLDAKSGSPVPNASVKLKGESRAHRPDGTGTVVFDSLAAGAYIVQAYGDTLIREEIPGRTIRLPRWSVNYDARRGTRVRVAGGGADTLVIRTKGKRHKVRIDFSS